MRHFKRKSRMTRRNLSYSSMSKQNTKLRSPPSLTLANERKCVTSSRISAIKLMICYRSNSQSKVMKIHFKKENICSCQRVNHHKSSYIHHRPSLVLSLLIVDPPHRRCRELQVLLCNFKMYKQ